MIDSRGGGLMEESCQRLITAVCFTQRRDGDGDRGTHTHTHLNRCPKMHLTLVFIYF